MKNIFPIIILIIGFLSCKSERVIEGNKNVIFSEIYSDDQIESQFFEIDTKRDTTLLGMNGTRIRIYENSFEPIRDSINIQAKIQVEIKEAYNPIDFVMGNLTATSNGQLLESGGMLYINAKSNGEELKLKEYKEIGIIVPV